MWFKLFVLIFSQTVITGYRSYMQTNCRPDLY